ncbi:MAG: HD-GYP domain-containing protein [Candidatus Scalindua sp.]
MAVHEHYTYTHSVNVAAIGTLSGRGIGLDDDGAGYPYGLKKYEIHLCDKIARIIDVYDALTSRRPYSDAIRPFKALVEMKEKMLNCFDKQLFIDFVHFLGPYDPRKEQRKSDKLKS